MLTYGDFQLVNQFSERNDNSHKEIITFEIHEVVAQRFALPALCHADRLTKRNQLDERKRAPKRNVAKRPVHAMLGKPDCTKHAA